MESPAPSRYRLASKVTTSFLATSLLGILVWYTFLQMEGKRPDIGMPKEAMDILKWMAVSSAALASMVFSFYRTLDNSEWSALQPYIRAGGARFVISTGYFLAALALGQACITLYELGGAQGPGRYIQSVLPVVALVFAGLGINQALGGLKRLMESAMTIAFEDDPNPLEFRGD
ncbi:hypothetical protein [Deinococcus sp. 6GRE01]|uniref:hypothetical protein n=1 Tax=Deinococcus sp. 6GRE01 TaxID=2745873 RepID=UPI001E3CA9FB|nr:hypothetical protein [Deinococcus sp. 6GRE01]MCD0156300.1 hypothetical protein [Deinococcus sp. 6GRE01]